jgi:hypothetical protein
MVMFDNFQKQKIKSSMQIGDWFPLYVGVESRAGYCGN